MSPESMMETKDEPIQDPQQGENTTPLDGIISRVKSYIAHPDLVSRDTLSQLLSELEDLKGYLDNEESSEPPDDDGGGGGADSHKPTLAISIGMLKKKGNRNE